MRTVLAIVSVLVTGCLQPGVHTCEDSSMCPADRVCAPRGGCVLPEQLAQCEGKADQATCTLPGANMGACFDGVCLPIGCGNGVLEAGEACDDGNTLAADGCSSRCDSTERCGNAFLDVNGAEQCDCGDASVPDAQRPPGCDGPNSDGASATCRTDCTLLGCGDGVANGLEECDGTDVPATCTQLGYYGGTLGCLASCRYDFAGCTGHCGDGARNGLPGQPIEVCDGGDLAGLDCTDLGFYVADALTCNPACFFDATGCRERCGDGLVNGPEACDGAPPGGLACVTAGHDAGQLGCAAACYETFENCRDVGLEFEFPGVALAPNLRGVWGSEGEFFACGLAGVIHTTGGAWTVMPGPPAMSDCDLWGTSANDVFLVGPANTGWGIYHYDGAAWTQVTGPATSPVPLFGIWGTSGSSVFAVGGFGRVLFFDGVTWQELATPLPLLSVYDVWASSGNDVFVVGANGLRYHWDGLSWVDQSSGATQEYRAVWGRSSTEVYAAGRSFVERYDGTSWVIVAFVSDGQLRDIVGMPNGSVVAVGFLSSSGQAIMTQQLGTTWLSLAPGVIGALHAVFATKDRLYAVGTSTIVGWSGASWITLPTYSPPLAHRLWAGAYNQMYATGADDNTGEGKLAHFNGSGWASTAAGAGFLFDVWANDPTRVVAVGAGGRALHGSGTTFVSKNTQTTERLMGVWGTGTIFYAVGTKGALTRWGGNNWAKETSPTSADLRDVWGTPSGAEVFAVGALGTILRRTGTTWTTMVSPTTRDLSAIWGRSASDVFAVGAGGTILHFDGATWSEMPSGTTADLTAIWGSTGDVLATGISVALQYVGGRWLPFALKTPGTRVTDLAGTADFLAFYTPTGVDLLSGRLFQPAAGETTCDDLWDDDDDGVTDCADPDCAADPACVAPGGCRPIIDVACGQVVAGTTVGGASRFPSYGSGCAPKDERGSEAYMRVRRPTNGTLQLALSGYTGDLDLIVAGASPQGACIADERCLAAAQTSGATESVGLAATANTDYVVIVDGSTASAFTLSVMCP